MLINLEQLLAYLACDIPPNSLPLRLQRMSHVKMLMKCLNGENTLAWEHAWSGILMAVHVDSWVKDFPSRIGCGAPAQTGTVGPGSFLDAGKKRKEKKTDILAQTLLSEPGKAAQTLPVRVVLVCEFIIKPIRQSASGRASLFHVIPC